MKKNNTQNYLITGERDIKITIARYTAICLVFIFAFLYIFASFGCFTKLKYANFENRVESSFLKFASYSDIDNKYVEESIKIKERADVLINEMIRFIKAEYDLDLIAPYYNLYVIDGEEIFTSGEKDSLTIYISKNKSESQKEYFEPLLIHELFHVLSAQNGYVTTISKFTNYSSKLVEGLDNILTDEFLDYAGYTSYLKIIPRTMYMFHCNFCKIILSEDKDNFLRFFFYEDTTFVDEFNRRVRNATNATLFFEPYENMEMHFRRYDEVKPYESEEDFLCIYEIMAYYSSTCKHKEKIEKIFNEIDSDADFWIYYDEKKGDYELFHKILYQ